MSESTIRKGRYIVFMPRPKDKYTIELEKLPKNVWYDYNKVKEHIEKNVDIEDCEKEPSKKNQKMTVWEHKFYDAISHMKGRGHARNETAEEYYERTGLVKPSGKRAHADRIMFIDKEPKERKQYRCIEDPKKYIREIKKMERDRWYTINEILEHLEKTVDFEGWELEWNENTYSKEWEHKVRQLLNRLHVLGHAEHDEQKRALDSLTGEFKPAMYKFKDSIDKYEDKPAYRNNESDQQGGEQSVEKKSINTNKFKFDRNRCSHWLWRKRNRSNHRANRRNRSNHRTNRRNRSSHRTNRRTFRDR